MIGLYLFMGINSVKMTKHPFCLLVLLPSHNAFVVASYTTDQELQ
jgi:hypothetical protein